MATNYFVGIWHEQCDDCKWQIQRAIQIAERIVSELYISAGICESKKDIGDKFDIFEPYNPTIIDKVRDRFSPPPSSDSLDAKVLESMASSLRSSFGRPMQQVIDSLNHAESHVRDIEHALGVVS